MTLVRSAICSLCSLVYTNDSEVQVLSTTIVTYLLNSIDSVRKNASINEENYTRSNRTLEPVLVVLKLNIFCLVRSTTCTCMIFSKKLLEIEESFNEKILREALLLRDRERNYRGS